MKKRGYISVLLGIMLVVVLVLTSGIPSRADSPEQTEVHKIRIGYCQVGGYYEFDYEIYQIGKALVEAGDIICEDYSTLKQGDSYDVVWQTLAAGQSEYYVFLSNCCYDLTDPEFYGLSEEEIDNKLSQMIEDNDIDLMLTMGTSAGIVVKRCSDVPYMNFLASNPVASGIVSAVEYSGSNRAWAHVNDRVESKALAVMNDIFHPEKIGIVYNEDNPDAYIYSGAIDVDEYAEENDVEVVKEYVVDEFEDSEDAYQEYYHNMCEAHEKLVSEDIDLYILTTSYLRLEDYYEALTPFMEKGIPVFSINSTEDVRCGALAAVEMTNYENIGRFAADTLKQYREGKNLGELSQQYATAPFLVLNIDSMRETGVQLPLDTLISASRLYGKYDGSEE